MGYLDLVERPTLLLDRRKVERNIERMAARARVNGVRLRPHFKTHQSAGVGEWFREHGVEAITVSSVDMAVGFAEAGWNDITIAFPVNLRQMGEINRLAEMVNLGLLVESAETARRLDERLTADVDVWLKIDAGYGRTGVHWQNEAALTAMANAVAGSRRLSLKGVLTHSGNTYGAGSPAGVRRVFGEAVARLRQVQAVLFEQGYSAAISVGDTPGCSLAESFAGLDEIRPGNYVFYDLMQFHIGACELDDIAVALACPVVALHPERGRIVVYGGAVHFSKDALPGPDGGLNFGRVVRLNEDGWTPLGEDVRVVSLSQEHGLIQADRELFDMISVGDVLGVLPVHSCLTADLLRRYLTLEGEWIECIPKR
jgi:D-serine deaminase-like pyridoxal phosphate-dependent protein